MSSCDFGFSIRNLNTQFFFHLKHITPNSMRVSKIISNSLFLSLSVLIFVSLFFYFLYCNVLYKRKSHAIQQCAPIWKTRNARTNERIFTGKIFISFARWLFVRESKNKRNSFFRELLNHVPISERIKAEFMILKPHGERNAQRKRCESC